MIVRSVLAAAVFALLPIAPRASAEALQYRGSLTDAGQPAQGAYALRLSLYDAARGGRRMGKEVTLVDVPVSEGRFEAEVDFGIPVAKLESSWMQVEVAGPEGLFEGLPERESLSAKALAGAACWGTQGNAGLNENTDFLGTTTSAALVLKANDMRVGRFSFGAISPNVVLGDVANLVRLGTHGATIGGGGNANGTDPGYSTGGNAIFAHYGTVSGGSDNSVGTVSVQPDPDRGVFAAIAGGSFNRAFGDFAFVAGGRDNTAGGDYSFVGGRRARVRSAEEGTPLTGDAGSFVWADDQDADFVTSDTDQFLVRSSGGISFNGPPPRRSRDLTVWGNGSTDNNVDIHLRPKDSTFGYGLVVTGASQADTNFLVMHTNGDASTTERMRIAANGDFTVAGNAFKPGGGSWAVASDARLKRSVEPLKGALDRLLALRGVRYEYVKPDTQHPTGVHDGFVAQQVQETFPHWVEQGADGYLMVAPQGFEALAVEALRELAQENALLREELERLKSRTNSAASSGKER